LYHQHLKKEEGFWSTFVILFLLTLTLMGLGAHILIKGEGPNTANLANVLQADYAANGAAYYGIRRLGIGALDESTPLVIGSGTVMLDSTFVSSSEEIELIVTANAGGTERGIIIRLQPSGKLADMAIYTTGDVFNVAARDSAGNLDPDRCVTNADSVPEINQAALDSLSSDQGHDQAAPLFTPDDMYADSSFYRPDGITPNVTHVFNDFEVLGGRTIYGIFVVEGNVILHGSARVEGVIYLPNPTSTIITGGGNPSESSITGGIVSHGDISGTGNHISVRHGPGFMRTFCEFQIGPDPPGFKKINWQYI
jgi:hypothetical protein